MKVSIVGAGVGGLALAVLLARRGHVVTVLERFTEPRPIGSGLLLQPTGLAAMDRLGARAAIEALGHRITRLHGLTDAGRTVFDLSYQDLEAGHYALAVHRAALHGVLWEMFQGCGAQLVLGHEVHTPDDPALAQADLIVDASGGRSPLRGFVTEQAPKPFTYGAVWASVPDIGVAHATLAQRYVKARIMLGYLPVGTRAGSTTPMAALFWSLRDDQYESWRVNFEGWRTEARALWPALAPVLDGLRGPEDFTHATYLHFDCKKPWRGNIVLIGDAAHATSPQLGQGANQALIDAVTLSDALAANNTLENAFAAYTKARRAHVRFYQFASGLMTPLFQSDSTLLAWLRDLTFHPMKRLPWMHRQMLHTLAGLKTGVFTQAEAAEIVNRLAKS